MLANILIGILVISCLVSAIFLMAVIYGSNVEGRDDE